MALRRLQPVLTAQFHQSQMMKRSFMESNSTPKSAILNTETTFYGGLLLMFAGHAITGQWMISSICRSRRSAKRSGTRKSCLHYQAGSTHQLLEFCCIKQSAAN